MTRGRSRTDTHGQPCPVPPCKHQESRAGLFSHVFTSFGSFPESLPLVLQQYPFSLSLIGAKPGGRGSFLYLGFAARRIPQPGMPDSSFPGSRSIWHGGASAFHHGSVDCPRGGLGHGQARRSDSEVRGNGRRGVRTPPLPYWSPGSWSQMCHSFFSFQFAFLGRCDLCSWVCSCLIAREPCYSFSWGL